MSSEPSLSRRYETIFRPTPASLPARMIHNMNRLTAFRPYRRLVVRAWLIVGAGTDR